MAIDNMKEEYFRVYLENRNMQVFPVFDKINIEKLTEWLEKNCICHDTVWWIDTRHEEVEKRGIPFDGNGYIVRTEKRRVYPKFGIIRISFNEDGTTSVKTVGKSYDNIAIAKMQCRSICESDVKAIGGAHRWRYISGMKKFQKLYGDYDCVLLKIGSRDTQSVAFAYKVVEFDVDITVS